ncbi:rRNA maturation RNase YbeY [Meridianimarinicoccus roseus]|uniref:Endoribonuclease YbeY n=1 Tax=Meridianimarinicoccus roseus TaxID=2072018 RepID=A0A2V2LCQ4_9RHOB|nr:rRNA maturation RNase YbeY [Meridianimarinicoccus roseus]PWR03248.1 rRNA maturation RNase YbeY [Meridianimarinicoccus roseus]
MPPLVDTLIEDPGWSEVGLESLAEAAAQAALSYLGLDPTRFEIALLGCSDARIAALNADFRGKPAPTNVLSWPSEDRAPQSPGLKPVLPRVAASGPPLELGDIAIAIGTCRAEADVAGVPLSAHVSHLMVHGVLHLLGFDHIDDADAELMEAAEVAILKGMGLPDPYSGAGADTLV